MTQICLLTWKRKVYVNMGDPPPTTTTTVSLYVFNLGHVLNSHKDVLSASFQMLLHLPSLLSGSRVVGDVGRVLLGEVCLKWMRCQDWLWLILSHPMTEHPSAF